MTQLAELRVLSNCEAEYGRNSGAIVNIVTKSGTNALHGTSLEYYRSGKFGARNYFNPAGQPKNPFHNNQFGGSLGGPIVKDKTFFFVDYEGQRETGAQAGASCVPDQALITATEAAIVSGGGAVNPVIKRPARQEPLARDDNRRLSSVTGCSGPNVATSIGSTTAWTA